MLSQELRKKTEIEERGNTYINNMINSLCMKTDNSVVVTTAPLLWPQESHVLISFFKRFLLQGSTRLTLLFHGGFLTRPQSWSCLTMLEHPTPCRNVLGTTCLPPFHGLGLVCCRSLHHKVRLALSKAITSFHGTPTGPPEDEILFFLKQEDDAD